MPTGGSTSNEHSDKPGYGAPGELPSGYAVLAHNESAFGPLLSQIYRAR